MVDDFYGGHEICLICNWEDDCVQLANPTSEGGANKESLAYYQEKVAKSIGFEIMEYMGYQRDKTWRPLTQSEILTANLKKAKERWHSNGIEDIKDVYWMKY